jgi:MFS family permease
MEGISDGLAGLARFGGGALADDPSRRRAIAVGGYTTTAVLSSVTGAATSVWQVGVLRAGAWAARGLRVPARNAVLADIVDPAVYGVAYGFERAMDNLGAIGGPILAIALVAMVAPAGRSGSRSSRDCSPPPPSSTPSATSRRRRPGNGPGSASRYGQSSRAA